MSIFAIMRFLIVAPRFHTNLYYRCLALQKAEHQVKVVVLYQGKSEYYENIDLQTVKLSFFSRLVSKIICLFKKQYLKSAFELRIEAPGKELNKIFKEYRPDVVLLKAYQNALAIKTLWIAKNFNTKVLMLTQTTYTHIKGSKLLFELNMKLFKYLNVFAYLTPVKENYRVFKDFGIDNIYYVPFIFPLPKDNLTEKINGIIKILSIGKFQKRKDQILLLKVSKRLVKEGFRIKLCLIGEAVNTKYIKTLYNFIRNNDLSEHICIKTNMPYPQVLKEYRKHDLFVLPAYNEPAAYSPVEALANGLPVICSNQNGTKDYIEEGINGFVFEARNENDLYRKIKNIVANENILVKMKKAALLSAQKEHSPEIFVKKIEEILSVNLYHNLR